MEKRSPLRRLLTNALSSYFTLICLCLGLIAGWMFLFLRLPPPEPTSDLEAAIRGAQLIMIPFLVFYAWPLTLIVLAAWAGAMFALKEFAVRNGAVSLLGWSRLRIWIMGLSLTAAIIGEMTLLLHWK